MSDPDWDVHKETDLSVTPPSQYGSSSPGISSPSSMDSPERADVPPPQRSKTAPPPPPPPPAEITNEDISSPSEAHIGIMPGILAFPESKESGTALRRTSSALSTGSSSGQTAREKKRLRFTPMASGSTGSPEYEEGAYIDPGDLEDGLGRRSIKGKGVPRDQVDYLKSDPGTPNLSETASQIRRTLSMASLDHLLLLSQNPSGEREKLLKEVSRAGKELVWRSENERKLFPRDGERALILAAKRGLRSFLLAFSTRAGVDVLLMLFRTWRKRKIRIAMIRHAIFGAVPLRFGAMIGTFTFLNTLTLHLLRLAPPMSYIRRRIRAGLFVKPTFGPPEREGPEGERRWQAAVAGAVGSLGLLWESQSRRTGVAQQMFVRGLQGSYNLYAPRLGVKIPHGDVLLFGLCCGQIMYAWLVSPETIPRAYSAWILQASRVPEHAVMANRTMVRQGLIEPIQVQRALNHRGVTDQSTSVLKALLAQVQGGWKNTGTLPCELVHPWCDSCTETSFRRFFAVFRMMLPVYGALHLIPTLVLRHQHVARSPLKMLLRVILGVTRSCSFLGVFVVIYQSLFCLRTRSLENWATGGLMNTLLRRKESFWLLGFSTCFSLIVEEKKRRAELAMYVLPRALESAWSSLRKRSYLPIVPFGETILGAGAMAMVMDAYKHQPTALSGVVRRLLFQLVGPV